MIPAGYLLITFLAQAFLTWLIVRLVCDEHRATEHALVARNAQDLHLLESAPIERTLRKSLAGARRRAPEAEANFPDSPIRPLGL